LTFIDIKEYTMKKRFFALLGLFVLAAILIITACVDPLTDVSAGQNRAKVAQMPLVNLSLFPHEFIFYTNQIGGMITVPLDNIYASEGILSFQWLVSDFSHGANAVEINNSASHVAAYGSGGTTNTLFLSLAPQEDYYANIGIRYYSLKIINTHPAPNYDYSPAVFETPFVKVTILEPYDGARVISVTADGIPYTRKTSEAYINFDSEDELPLFSKENIVIHGSAKLGDGAIELNGNIMTVPLKDVERGRILLAIKGINGIEECYYGASLFDDTPLLYSVTPYQVLGPERIDVGTNRLRLEFNLPVDLTIPEIEILNGLMHPVLTVPLVRNNGGRIWTVHVDAFTIEEMLPRNFAPTIRLEETVGVSTTEALEKSIIGAKPLPHRIEWIKP